MTLLRHLTQAVVASLLVTSAGALAADCQQSQLRSEAARILWTTRDVIRATPLKGAVLVQTRVGIRLLEGKTGTELWHHTYRLGEYEQTPEFVVLRDSVAMVQDDQEIVFLDLKSGIVRNEVDLGQGIRYLVGPPLVAVTEGVNSDVSSLLLVTPDGEVGPPSVVPRVTEAFVYDKVLVLEHGDSLDGSDTDMLLGYCLEDLQQLWSFTNFTFNTQTVDGVLLIGDIVWSKGATAIDVHTGKVVRTIPARDPFKIGGSSYFDLQVVSSEWKGAWSPYFATCEKLRRNDVVTGATMWTADLPFHVTGTLRDGDVLYVAGSRDAEHRYVLLLDWRTGEIVRAWTQVPLITEMSKSGSLLFGFDLAAQFVALDLNGSLAGTTNVTGSTAADQ